MAALRLARAVLEPYPLGVEDNYMAASPEHNVLARGRGAREFSRFSQGIGASSFASPYAPMVRGRGLYETSRPSTRNIPRGTRGPSPGGAPPGHLSADRETGNADPLGINRLLRGQNFHDAQGFVNHDAYE